MRRPNIHMSTATIEKLAILDGGIAQVEDGSIYSPGYNVDVPMTLSCNTYLLRHRSGWLLWDTGIEDALAAAPAGKVSPTVPGERAADARGLVGRTWCATRRG